MKINKEDQRMENENENGISYADVKKFAKVLGLNIVGKEKDAAINIVLDGIYEDYVKNQDKRGSEFEEYKKINKGMLSWYRDNKDYSGAASVAEEVPAETEPEEASAIEPFPAEEPTETEEEAVVVESKELGKVKDKADNAKTEAKKKKAGKKESMDKTMLKSGMDGLFSSGSKYDFVYSVLKKGPTTLETLLKAYKKKYGPSDTGGTVRNIAVYVYTITKKLASADGESKLLGDKEKGFYIG